MLLESICIVCISIFPPSPINLKEKNNKKSHAYHIKVGLKTVGLTNCQTVELSITNFEQNIEMDYTSVGYDRFYCLFLLVKHCPYNDKAFLL